MKDFRFLACLKKNLSQVRIQLDKRQGKGEKERMCSGINMESWPSVGGEGERLKKAARKDEEHFPAFFLRWSLGLQNQKPLANIKSRFSLSMKIILPLEWMVEGGRWDPLMAPFHSSLFDSPTPIQTGGWDSV